MKTEITRENIFFKPLSTMFNDNSKAMADEISHKKSDVWHMNVHTKFQLLRLFARILH